MRCNKDVNIIFSKRIVTKAQRKKEVDRDLIRQTFMLMCTNQENDFASFRKNDIDIFVASHSELVTQEKIDVLLIFFICVICV